MELSSRHKYLETRKICRNKNHNYWQLNLVMAQKIMLRQPNEEAARNDVVTEDIRSRLPAAKNKTKKVATSN